MERKLNEKGEPVVHDPGGLWDGAPIVDVRMEKDIHGVRDVICDSCNAQINSQEEGKEHEAAEDCFVHGTWVICHECEKNRWSKEKADEFYPKGFDLRKATWY